MNEIIFDFDRDNFCETIYLENITKHLNEKIDSYSIICTANLHTLPKSKNRKLVILIGDENGEGHNYKENVKVFRYYNLRNISNIYYPIPCGYNSSGYQMKKMYPEKKLQDRKYDIVFYGQRIGTYRKDMFDIMDELSDKFNMRFNVNSTFRSGLNIDEYYKLLGNSKISFVPNGTAVETFRYNESFGSGCVVVTPKTFNLWYYEKSPAHFIDNWNQVDENFVQEILNGDLNKMYKENLEYYNNYLSEEAVANYIIKKL